MPQTALATAPEAPGFLAVHEALCLETRGRPQFIDLTERVADLVRRSGVIHGMVNVQTRHTTTAILVNENEPLLLGDLRRRLEAWASCRAEYRHDDFSLRDVPPDEPRNGHAHARAVLLGSSETLNIIDGAVALGRWQRIFLVELDGPRTRSVSVMAMGVGQPAGSDLLRPAASRQSWAETSPKTVPSTSSSVQTR